MKKLSKRFIEFFFGKKYPIFNKEGEIEHSRELSFQQWEDRFKKDPNYDWNNHAGLYFTDSKKSKKNTC
ncbi:MAG: hypothetical protein GDA46_06790 [Bdellovibrionales bacterium]|nr:hypothetical protein [Bdellovibrionales bacterium]